MNASRFSMARRVALAVVVTFAAPAVYAVGGPNGATVAPGSKIALSDVRWLEKAAFEGNAEVETGKLAAAQAQHVDVRRYGQTVAVLEGKAMDELRALAASKGVLLPIKPDAAHQRLLLQLAAVAPDKFDRQYMLKGGSDDDVDVAELYQKGIDSLQDPDLREFATRHLQMIKQQFADARDTREEIAGPQG